MAGGDADRYARGYRYGAGKGSGGVRIGPAAPCVLVYEPPVNRLKVLAHDGIGLWLCARRLYQGRFVWPVNAGSGQIEISRAQLDALVIGLPWQRVGVDSVIALV